jgi:UDP-glucose 4-epimerase
MGKKVVVFGGGGFIGSHLADTLVDKGYEVAVFDRMESPYLRPEQEMIVGDILNIENVRNAIKGRNIVYHLAGVAGIDDASNDRLTSITANVLGTTNILEACHEEKVDRFVFASSLYVYSALGSFYRATKQACEILIKTYGEIGVPYTILRYGSLYGTRADERNFIYTILKQALVEGKITRGGDGEELREYIHVLDAAEASIDVLSDEFVNQYVVLTGNQQIKIKDLLLMIREMVGNKIELEFVPATFSHHYEITPYSFEPKVAKRLNRRTYLDLGQGILDCIHHMYKEFGGQDD